MDKLLLALLGYADEVGVDARVRGIVGLYAGGCAMAGIAEGYDLSKERVRCIIRGFELNVSDYLDWRRRIVDEELLERLPELGLSQLKQTVVEEYAAGSSYAAVAAAHTLTPCRVRVIVSRFMRAVDNSGERIQNAAAGRLVGARLRRRRQDAHLTLEQLAAQCGLSGRTIQRYELGDVQNIGSNKLKRIGGVLGFTLDELLRPVADTD